MHCNPDPGQMPPSPVGKPVALHASSPRSLKKTEESWAREGAEAPVGGDGAKPGHGRPEPRPSRRLAGIVGPPRAKAGGKRQERAAVAVCTRDPRGVGRKGPGPAPREKPPPAGEGSGAQNGEGAGQAKSDVAEAAEAGGAIRPPGKRAAESRPAPRFPRSSNLRGARPSWETQKPRQGPPRPDRAASD